jgi:hypothetical protein
MRHLFSQVVRKPMGKSGLRLQMSVNDGIVRRRRVAFLLVRGGVWTIGVRGTFHATLMRGRIVGVGAVSLL